MSWCCVEFVKSVYIAIMLIVYSYFGPLIILDSSRNQNNEFARGIGNIAHIIISSHEKKTIKPSLLFLNFVGFLYF